MPKLNLLLSITLLVAIPCRAGVVGQCVLADFESDSGSDDWTLELVSAEPAASGGSHALRLSFGERDKEGPWPTARLRVGRTLLPNNDWRGYDKLTFEVTNPGTKVIELRAGLSDSTGRVASGTFSIPAGETMVCAFQVSHVFHKVPPIFGTRSEKHFEDPERILDFYILLISANDLLLDNVKLVADSLAVESAVLGLDPLGAGAIAIEARTGRCARFDLRVLDNSGTAISRHTKETDNFHWSWDNPLELATLSPGSYSASLTVTDFKWLPDGGKTLSLGSFEVKPEMARPALAAWYVPSTQKVMLHSRPAVDAPVMVVALAAAEKLPPARIEMARGEVEGVQVVFLAGGPSRLGLAIEGLRHERSGAAFPLEGNEILQVGYVKTEDPGYYEVDFTGWWPDALLPVDEMYAEPGECMPVWVNLRSTREMEPGTYRGNLTVSINGKPGGEIPLEVRVYDVTLPVETTIRTAFATSDDLIDEIYGGTLPEGMLRKYHQFVADHRLNVDNIYRGAPPDIETVEYFARRGQLNAFNLRYIGGRIDRVDQFDNEQYLQELARMFDPYVAELRKRGLAHLAYFYGFDEIGGEMFEVVKRTYGFLKKRYPEIPTMTTGRDPSFGIDSGLEDEVDIWVPLTPVYDLKLAEQARARGKEVWWYICISPPHPYANWFVEYPAIEARLLWWMTYQYQVPGFLYYLTNLRHNQDDLMRLTGHNKTNWNPASWRTANGDGCFIYSGPDGPISTIRFENIRDGLEDSELLFLLEKRLGDSGGRARQYCGELIESLTEFTHDSEKFAAVRRDLLSRLEKLNQ
ncbi:glycoside hydrolase domain-containing protein [Gemmatimonadota bacterium]